ncbi:potassium channel family protein [Pseudidiomarina gelatinasegens]|uniref:potassium channel family protein n=1 Tax=Pseudidiomarina gelatinasegens TaxID=2487740 RepID=UPI003A9785A2
MKMSPVKVFIAYILVIAVCAALYFFLPDVLNRKVTFGDSLYFSVVTITTLGYGDLSPISDVGKAIAAIEALMGVLLIGMFLQTVSNQLLEKEERKRIEAAKDNLKAQYNAWRHDIIYSLLFLAEPGKGVDAELPDRLTDADMFREYFRERWNAIANNISSESYYSNEIVHGLEAFQHHIETFLTVSRISNSQVLKQLTRYVNHLRNLRRRNLDEHDDQKGFMRDLWSILAQWDYSSGYHKKDILLEAIDSA